MTPVDHSGRVGWEGQLSQLADLLETDPESGMQSLRGFILPPDLNHHPHDQDGLFHCCDAAQAAMDEMPDEHGPTGLNESTVLARAIGSQTLAQRGAMGHHGADDYQTCREPKHWEKLPVEPELTEYQKMRREMLADEIEMDML